MKIDSIKFIYKTQKFDTYLVSNLITNDIGDYSLTVDDFISFFSDNSSDSDISKIKKSSTDFGLGDSDISFWKDDTTYYEKRTSIYRLFGENCNRLKLKKVVSTTTGTDIIPNIPNIKIERANKLKKTYSRGNESIHIRAILNSKLDKDLLIRYKVNQGVNLVETKEAVIKANKRYVDIYYITNDKYLGQEISLKLENFLSPDNKKYYDFVKKTIIYNFKEINSKLPFTKISDVNLLLGNKIVDTRLKKGYVFSFSVEENSDFSYVVIDYPHLKIDSSQIRLETFDFANTQYIPVDTLTSNFRSLRKIKGIRVNRVSLKVRSHNKNKLWKLHFDGLLTRLDNIELVKIQLRNSKFENFIEKNMYSKKEIKELKERYDEMVWRKDLLENGIQYEIRLKRDDEFSQPEVKKLIQIGVDKKPRALGRKIQK